MDPTRNSKRRNGVLSLQWSLINVPGVASGRSIKTRRFSQDGELSLGYQDGDSFLRPLRAVGPITIPLSHSDGS